MELVAAGLAAEALEQKLPAEVAEGQREERLPHLRRDEEMMACSATIMLAYFVYFTMCSLLSSFLFHLISFPFPFYYFLIKLICIIIFNQNPQ